WNAQTGTLTLIGTASAADYQAALRAVRYTNSSDAPSTVDRSVTLVVSDGSDASAPAVRGVSVVAIDDPAVVTASAGSAAYTENSAPVALDPGLSIFDADSAMLVGATVRIIGDYAAGQDVLWFADLPGINGSWDAMTGTLTLTGAQ